jgi:hypothetical protein
MKVSIIFFAVLGLSACATAPKLDAVPVINGNTLPLLNAKKIRPPALMLEVVNMRSANQASQNSEQVAAAVKDALNVVIANSGLADGKTTNLWRLELQDCEAPQAKVCLKIKNSLNAGTLRYEGSAFSSNNSYYGLNEAYTDALTSLIKGMNEKTSGAK